MIFDIALTMIFVLANAFFVAAEFAIVKVRASQIELLVREGSYLAKLSKNMVSHLDAYLSATQLGITLASLGLGWIGESVVASIIIDLLALFGMHLSPEIAHKIALPIAFLSITFLHIVFGELAPKSLAIQYPEKVTLSVSLPLRVFYFVFQPFIWVLNSIANKFIKIIGLQSPNEQEQLHSSEELRYLLEESSKSGLIDTEEHELLENVFDFAETPVKQIMVPRTRITAIDKNMHIDKIIEKFIEEGFSRLPVYDGSIDNIVGEIYGKDLLNLMANRNLIAFTDIIRPPFLVSEDEKIHKLLKTMQREHAHLAIVLNEFGGVAGLVTLEDIIEEIVGEIQDEYDEEEPMAEETAKNEFEIDAFITIDDANEFLPEPLPESEDYETLSGYITSNLGRIPLIDESFVIERYRFTILQGSERRIEEVKIELIDIETDEEIEND